MCRLLWNQGAEVLPTKWEARSEGPRSLEHHGGSAEREGQVLRWGGDKLGGCLGIRRMTARPPWSDNTAAAERPRNVG